MNWIKCLSSCGVTGIAVAALLLAGCVLQSAAPQIYGTPGSPSATMALSGDNGSSAGGTLIGTPNEVRDGLGKYLDATGYERVLLLMALPGLPTDLALRSMRLFADQVAPAMGVPALRPR